MISVLLPTRGRPDSLRRSVESLVKLADHPERLEVAIAVDRDDPYVPAAREVVHACGAHVTLCWEAPERYGYSQLHRYFNQLARMSHGEWLLLWNDDAVMTSPGWDTAIESLDERVIVADCWSPPHSPWLITFPAVRRWTVETLGTFSAHTCHCDTYWEMIGRAIPGGTEQVKGATVFHDRNDLTGNHNDATWTEGQAGYQRQHFYSEPVQAAIRADIETLRAAHDQRFSGAA